MKRRIKCLWHQESTPSLVQRKYDWKCYGACNKTFTNKQIEERSGEHFEYQEEENEERENIEETFAYIRSLPLLLLRGLLLPSDERGYFICWPNSSYYKYRIKEFSKGSKYIGPRGHIPPLFWAKKDSSDTLFVAEGEVNSLSLALAFPEADHCSPGSASMFTANNLSIYLTQFQKYSKVIVVLDNDAAGLKALIETRAYFMYKIPFLTTIQLAPDANDLLCEGGPKKLREEVSRYYSG